MESPWRFNGVTNFRLALPCYLDVTDHKRFEQYPTNQAKWRVGHWVRSHSSGRLRVPLDG